MPSKIILDLSEPGVVDVAKDAVAGEPLILQGLTIIPTRIDETMVEGEISEITVNEIPEVEEETPEAAEGPIAAGMPTENTGGFDEGNM